MGSTSDWETMQHTAQTLDQLGVAYEKRVISAHRTPKLMYEWGLSARDRGLKVVIAGAGGAAHLAGVAAALTPVPVLGVPMESASLKGSIRSSRWCRCPVAFLWRHLPSANPARSTPRCSPRHPGIK